MDEEIIRPQLTFALFTFNQELFIGAAVTSALAQTYTPLEIILSDDCSSDRTFEIMAEMLDGYDGPHKVVLRRNSVNLGLIKHVNIVTSLATSDYIVVAAGDDISETHRVATHSAHLGSKPLLLHSGFTPIDCSGKFLDNLKVTEEIRTHDIYSIAVSRSLYVGATGVWNKDLFRIFGEISQLEAYEDLVLGYRAALLGRIAYVPERLVRYRVGNGVSTQKRISSKQKIRHATACKASLQQRRIDTLKMSPERLDLLKGIDREINVETVAIAFFSRNYFVLFRYLLKKEVMIYFKKEAFRLVLFKCSSFRRG